MARTPDGAAQQPRTDTALFAHIAYKLEGVATADLNTWAGELGVRVGADALRNAPHHAARLDRLADRRSILRPWFLPDWRALDFFAAVARLRMDGRDRTQIDRLEADRGVVDLLASEGEVTVIVIYERRSDRDALRARLEDFGSIAGWQEVEGHRPAALVSTFRSLAREAAERELLAQPASP